MMETTVCVYVCDTLCTVRSVPNNRSNVVRAAARYTALQMSYPDTNAGHGTLAIENLVVVFGLGQL